MKKTADSSRSSSRTPRRRGPRSKSEGGHNAGWENATKHAFKKNDPVTGEKDPRINRTGQNAKASSQKELETAIQNFLNADNPIAKGTTLDVLFNIMLTGQALDRKTLMEYGFGKRPAPIEQKFDGPLTIKFVDETEGETEATTDTTPNIIMDDDTGDADGSDPSSEETSSPTID